MKLQYKIKSIKKLPMPMWSKVAGGLYQYVYKIELPNVPKVLGIVAPAEKFTKNELEHYIREALIKQFKND